VLTDHLLNDFLVKCLTLTLFSPSISSLLYATAHGKKVGHDLKFQTGFSGSSAIRSPPSPCFECGCACVFVSSADRPVFFRGGSQCDVCLTVQTLCS
jgi:hypothetical protein